MMEFAEQKVPSLWVALLWKDFQQVKPTFVAVLAGVFSVQLILLLAGLLNHSEYNRMALFGGTVTFACIGPILLALGCSGMLIGQERQSGTWAWSSSLPVSWIQALSSKLLVSIVGSLIASIPLTIIPIGLLITRQLDKELSSNIAIYALALPLFIFVEVVVFCFLATVLIRETLTALVVAGVGLAVIQIFVWNSFSSAFPYSYSRHDNPDIAEYRFAIFVSGVLLTGFILMTLAYRWRWGVGQQSKFAFSPNSKSFKLPITANYQYAVSSSPSEWWMMLRHSLSNSFWLRIIVLIGMLVYGSYCRGYPPELDSIVLLVAIGLLGITTFEADQTQNRFRFLTDRGVSPWKLVVCRITVAFAFAAVAYSVYALRVELSYEGSSSTSQSTLWLSPLAFLIGVLSSLCFRKSIMAMMAALVMCFVGFAANAFILNWLHFAVLTTTVQRPDDKIEWIVLYFTPVASVVLLAAIFGMSRRWLVSDEPKLERHFLWISLTAFLSPILSACTLGFLTIPNVPWKDMTFANDLSVILSTTDSTELPTLNEPLLVDRIAQLSMLSSWRIPGLQGVEDTAHAVLGDVVERLKSKRVTPKQDLAEVIKSLPQLEDLLNGRTIHWQHVNRVFPTLIVRTAALATVALQNRDSELALRIWRLNRELQELASEFSPIGSHASRNVAMHLLNEISDADVQAIGGESVFKSLIPSVPDERVAQLKEDYDEAVLRRRLLNMPPTPSHWFALTRYYPPLRWLNERQISYDLERRRGAVEKLPKNLLTEQSRSQLVSRFPE